MDKSIQKSTIYEFINRRRQPLGLLSPSLYYDYHCHGVQSSFLAIFGELFFWKSLTTDPETLPENSTWFIMTKVPGIKYKEVGK